MKCTSSWHGAHRKEKCKPYWSSLYVGALIIEVLQKKQNLTLKKEWRVLWGKEREGSFNPVGLAEKFLHYKYFRIVN